VFALLQGCGDTEFEFSSRPCFLYIDNSIHQDATLQAAMTPYSNVFVKVTKEMDGGVQYFRFESNHGASSRVKLDAWDLKRTLILGANNGVIVGYGSLSDPLTFYAFDKECPNCFMPDQVPVRSRPLKMTTGGMAVCSVCGREYDMNIGGKISKGDKGSKMTRYRTKIGGPLGVLEVF
jgi:hypothetical protein